MDINPERLQELKDGASGKLLLNEPLAKYTTWRTGGCADLVFIPSDLDDLQRFLVALPDDIPITIIGLGSNTLVLDGGIKGVVIISQGSGLNGFELLDEHLVYAEAGVACGQLARFCSRNALAGAEFLAGIPGTLGGALAMNAGCYGSEIWEFVSSVKVMTRQGEIVEKTPDDFDISYRSVFADDVAYFLSATLRLMPGNKTESLAKIKSLIATRNAAQPTNYPNCGSVFRNPPGDYAARLIEVCGLKGKHCGGAQISEKHANFIVNLNHASSEDILSLIKLARDTVKDQFAIELKTEVKVVGEKL